MRRTKIDYGIDLGTTNSAIIRMDKGEKRIFKSDHGQQDTTPSCVSINKKKVMSVGVRALNELKEKCKRDLKKGDSTGSDAFEKFKRTMGEEKVYKSVHMDRSYTSEELSAEVLKKLKSYVQPGEEVSAVVITVPSKFRQNQIDATQRAAQMAGFRHCELLQEPIAASYAYGIKGEQRDGKWLVFDYGGGTFDVALMQSNEGIIKVIETEGNNHLGGNELDEGVVNEILMPYLEKTAPLEEFLSKNGRLKSLKTALAAIAEVARIELSSKDEVEIYQEGFIEEDDNGDEVELDLQITQEAFAEVVEPIYQRAVDITKKLLMRKGVKGKDLTKILLVGGPTLSPILRDMLKEQISEKIDVSVDPMTAVALGAALHASTRDLPVDYQTRDLEKVQLKLEYAETTVETEEPLAIRVDRSSTTGAVPEEIFVEVSREDGAWNSGRAQIQNDADILAVSLQEKKTNVFSIQLYDESGSRIPCEPSHFTIIQGVKIGSATLTYNYGVSVVDTKKNQEIFSQILGLGKNQSLPAKGKGKYLSQKDVRPGNTKDRITIPIYEGGHDADGTRAAYHQYAGMVMVNGDDLSGFLPEESEVELTINVDESRNIMVGAYFPHLDEDVVKRLEPVTQRDVSSSDLVSRIRKAKGEIEQLEEDSPGYANQEKRNLDQELGNLQKDLKNGEGVDTRTQVDERLQEVLKDLDKLRESSEWPKVKAELEGVLQSVIRYQKMLGDDETQSQVDDLKRNAEQVIEAKDERMAKIVIKSLRELHYRLIEHDRAYWATQIHNMSDGFEYGNWKNIPAAKELIEDGKRMILQEASAEQLEYIVYQIWALLADSTDSTSEDGGDVVIDRYKLKMAVGS